MVALKDGSVVRVSIGNGPDDPIFTIDDLLPHLGVEAVEKTPQRGHPCRELEHPGGQPSPGR